MAEHEGIGFTAFMVDLDEGICRRDAVLGWMPLYNPPQFGGVALDTAVEMFINELGADRIIQIAYTDCETVVMPRHVQRFPNLGMRQTALATVVMVYYTGDAPELPCPVGRSISREITPPPQYVLRFSESDLLDRIGQEAGRELTDEEAREAITAVKAHVNCGPVYEQFSELVRTHTDIFD